MLGSQVLIRSIKYWRVQTNLLAMAVKKVQDKAIPTESTIKVIRHRLPNKLKV